VSVLSGFAVLAASVLLLELPYRTIWQNEFPRVNLVSARCYVIGERATDWLLHCPELTPPRNRVVARTDPALERLGKVESIFTPR
jgi:hypothetical protein